MIRSIPRAIAVALLGALAGPICLVALYARDAGSAWGIDRLAPISTGFYAVERGPDGPFVWTSRRADVTFAGLDRRSGWTCSVRFRGARPEPLPQPDLQVAVDGVTVAVKTATNSFEEIRVPVPARPARAGLVFSLTSSTTFVPGPADKRALGVQITELGCGPAGDSVALAPGPALRSSALAAGAFGLSLGLTGITAGSAVGATVLLAVAQAVPLASGAAPYSGYPDKVVWLAAWVALLMLVVLKAIEGGNRQALRNTARFAVLFSAGAFYLKVLLLLHPSKAIVDALFHAHRFESVLAGHWYFTQLSTSATPFPYAIGLYLFAIPWSIFTHDHVALLRVVVCAVQAVAGGLVYLMIVRNWGDRLVGAIAVALCNLVPITYGILGYSNLTNAFGSAVAFVTIAALTAWPLQGKHVGQLAVLTLLATLAFMSHVSTVTLLVPAMVLIAFLYLFSGAADLRASGRMVLAATVVGLVLSVVLYWGHFGDLYKKQLAGMKSATVAGAVAPTPAAARNAPAVVKAGAQTSPAPRLGRSRLPLTTRVRDAVSQTVRGLGWPMLLLAAVGAWRLLAARRRDRLVYAVLALASVCLLFVTASVLLPRDMKFQQDAWEFTARVEDLTAPAVVILAAFGAGWAWRAHAATRVASIAVLFAAVVLALRLWMGWI